MENNENEGVAGRRPIATRDAKFAKRLASALAKSRITPNQISAASVVFAAIAGGAFAVSGGENWIWLLIAALGIQGRLMCNLLDGMVAVEGGKGGPDGPFWNEAPDRYADVLIIVGMGFGVGAPALGWAAACMAVLVAYSRELGTAQGFDPDFSGPFAKQHRMALATGAAILAMFVPQLFGVATVEVALWVLAVGGLVTALVRSKRLIASLKLR